MLIDNTDDKKASKEEQAIWQILKDYGMNEMVIPNCSDKIIELVNKLPLHNVNDSKRIAETYDHGYRDGYNTCASGGEPRDDLGVY